MTNQAQQFMDAALKHEWFNFKDSEQLKAYNTCIEALNSISANKVKINGEALLSSINRMSKRKIVNIA